MTFRPLPCVWLLAAALVMAGVAAWRRRGRAGARLFPGRSDRRRSRDPGRLQACKNWDISDPYDFFENTFLKPGDRTPRRALNINTADEVPDSSWFTNRAGVRALSARRGPTRAGHVQRAGAGPVDGRVRQERRHHAGIHHPRLCRRHLVHQVRSRTSNPEMATGAEMVVHQALLGAWLPRAREPPGHAPARQPRDRRQGHDRDIRRAAARAHRRRRRSAAHAGRPQRRWHLPGDCEQGARGPAARPVPLLRHAARRSQRHPPAPASPRAARHARVLGVAEPRRLAQRQLPGHARRTGRPPRRLASPDRLRLHARQRQPLRAEAARRQRVHLGSAADAS